MLLADFHALRAEVMPLMAHAYAFTPPAFADGYASDATPRQPCRATPP
jgi:hypothetical protein